MRRDSVEIPTIANAAKRQSCKEAISSHFMKRETASQDTLAATWRWDIPQRLELLS